MKQWNIGNTTIRNPNRIPDGLKLLKKFEGKIWDYQLQAEFYDAAKKIDILKSESKEITPKSKTHFARKWAACFNQLGFARAWKDKGKGPVEITDIGNLLVNDEITFEEAMLRQLLKYQLPSIIEKGKKYKGFHFHPFRVFLEVIYGLHEQGVKGLTGEEIGLYVITTLRNDKSVDAVRNIVEYRNDRAAIKGNNPKLDYFRNKTKKVIADIFLDDLKKAKQVIADLIVLCKESKDFLKSQNFETNLRGVLSVKERAKQKIIKRVAELIAANSSLEKVFDYYLSEFVGTKGRTLKDYSDTTIRYALTTGLFSLNRDRIVIKPNKVDLIKSILHEETKFIEDKDYLTYFYNPELPELPLDDEHFMILNVGDLQEQIETLSEKTGIEVEPLTTVERSVPKLKKISQQLEKKLIEQKEYLFYKDQSLDEQIDDIIDYFKMIKSRTLLGGDAYFPAYYEWAIWRVFLAINTLVGSISDTRNFQIDEELKPIHHAKGGVPDMVFNYEDFAIVCEATLHQSVSQWSAEYTSVPKHIANMTASTTKPVFGIFIAPRIEPNMAQLLFNATWHINDEFMNLNIVPFSTEQVVALLQNFKKKKFNVKELKVALEQCIDLKTEVKNGKEWYELISKVLPGPFYVN